MTGLASLRRPSTGDDLTPDLKTESTRYFSPDILHVFSDDQNANTQAVISETLVTIPRQQNAPSSFPQFSRLPMELRYLIWEAAVPEPTIIPRTWNSACGYNLQRKVPTVLHACSESRRLLIAPAERRNGASSPKYQLVQRRGKQDEGVYLNWRTDSIWIYRGYDIAEVEVGSYCNLQHLVMNWGVRPCWVESALDEGISFIRRFPKLNLLTLLVDFSEHGWPEPSTLKCLKRLKRNEVKRIWGLVQKAFREARKQDPLWSPPSLRMVHRTANWSRQEA